MSLIETIILKVNNFFAEVTVTQPQFLGRLWTNIDDVVNLKRCEVFSYSPDLADESNYVNVWSFHYFFFNKDSNTLVYFTTAAKRYFEVPLISYSKSKTITFQIIIKWL